MANLKLFMMIQVLCHTTKRKTLRWTLHNINLNFFQVKHSVAFIKLSICTAIASFYLVPKHSHHPKRRPCTPSAFTPHSSTPQLGQPVIHILFVGLLTLDFSHKWTGLLYIDTKEYYTTLEKKIILEFAITWINFDDTMLFEINHAQKVKYWTTLFASRI